MKKENWYLITIDVFGILNGSSIVQAIKFIIKKKQFNYIIADNLDWVGQHKFINHLKETKKQHNKFK